nr:diguanylate cyclase [Wenzhouxiangella sp. XN79A]
MLSAISSAAVGQAPVVLPVAGEITRVQDSAWVRPDDGSLERPADVLAAEGFQPIDALEASPEGPAWLRIPLQAPEHHAGSWKITVKRRYFRELELFVPTADGAFQRYSNSLAEYQPVELSAWFMVYPLTLAPGQRAELVLRAETLQGPLSPLDISIQTEAEYLGERATAMWAFGLYFGAVIALVFYNLVLYLNLRTPGHRMYVLAMTAVLLFMGMDAGLLQNLLPEALRERELMITVTLSCLMMAATIRFFQVFSGSAERIPRISTVLTVVALAFLVLAGITAFAPLGAAALFGPLAQLMTSIMVFVLIAAAALAGWRGSNAAWIFLAGWSAFLIGGFVRSLIGVEAIPRTEIAEYALYVGSVLEAMILALGLSYRVGQLREQRIRAEHEQHRAMTLANQDALTGAYNRRFFENYLDTLLEDQRRSNSESALLFLDIDWFKQINDTHGHEAGDVMLRSLTRRCLRELREGDVLCRLGGDEFAVVLRSLSGRAAVDVARRIHRSVTDAPVHYDGQPLALKISIGVLARFEPGMSRSDVLRQADQALYAAKQQGRNRVACSSSQ